MTADRRFEADLPEILADLYLGSTPSYRDTILQRTAGHGQRAAWTFPERWIPMTDTTLGSRPATRVPLRPIAYILLLVAIALTIGLAAFIASRPRLQLPTPYGPAANGMLVYSSGGDIYMADPTTGVSTAIVTGPELDRNPIVSRDGTRIAFRRATEDPARYDLVVADADGSHPVVVSPDPIVGDQPLEWTADGSGLMAWIPEGERLVRFDAAGGDPTVIAAALNAGGDILWEGSLRPPDSAEVLFRNDDDTGLMAMSADGTGRRTIATSQTGCEDFGRYAWSPDGTKVAYIRTTSSTDCNSGLRIFVADADGTNEHQLTDEPGTWWEPDFAWSPDSSRIAMVRWHKRADGTDEIRPIGIAAVDGGRVVEVGPVSASEGSIFEWSPDGSKIVTVTTGINDVAAGLPAGLAARPIEIDVADGNWHELPFEVRSAVSWQRIAP